MQEMLGFTSIPAIVIICLLIAQAIKTTKLDNKYLPVICGCLGGILGVAAMYVMADFPADDVFTAAAVGIVSGFAATGVNQVKKQLLSGADQK